MKIRFKLIGIFFLIISLHSCKKKVHEINPDFIGKWYGGGGYCSYIIEINKKSKGTWIKSGSIGGDCNHESKGRFRIKGDIMTHAGFKFKIHEPPTPIDNPDTMQSFRIVKRWRMEVQCISFYCNGDRVIYYKE